MEAAELEKYDAVATWHTHPKTSANLSSSDWRMFKAQDSLKHYIVSEHEVRGYFIANGKVLTYENPL